LGAPGGLTGTVNQELLLRNQQLAAENQVLRGQLTTGRLRLSEGEKATLGWIQSGTQGALGREFAGGEQEMS